MKHLFYFVLFLLPMLLFAQNDSLKHDYIWLTGYSSNPDQLEFGGTVIGFYQNPPEVYYEYREQDFDIASVTMCDAEGNLIFSSNNYTVYNSFNEVMENGSGLNPSPAFHDRVIQSILGLPHPENDSLYLLLHNEYTFVPEFFNGAPVINLSLRSTTIDMKHNLISNNYLGEVIEKNAVVHEGDTLSYGKLTATRHANGRDWWILQQEYGTNKFFRFLLDPSGVNEQDPLIVGSNQLYNTSGAGQAVFSPDGTKYILVNAWDTQYPAHVDFFDFDRCTGMLSNFERVMIDISERPRGVAVSPNSKYCYLSTTQNYYQIDLDQSPKQLTLIEAYDGTGSRPFTGQLAPNGKIYFSGSGTHQEMHIIHNPNEAGVACDLEQHGLSLPTYNSYTIPNHPNYRLGRLIGSPCDTVYTDDTTVIANTPLPPQSIDVFPNPTSSNINFEISEAADFMITDYLGQVVKEGRVRSGENALDVSGFVSGVYFLTLEGDVSRVARFVVQKE